MHARSTTDEMNDDDPAEAVREAKREKSRMVKHRKHFVTGCVTTARRAGFPESLRVEVERGAQEAYGAWYHDGGRGSAPESLCHAALEVVAAANPSWVDGAEERRDTYARQEFVTLVFRSWYRGEEEYDPEQNEYRRVDVDAVRAEAVRRWETEPALRINPKVGARRVVIDYLRNRAGRGEVVPDHQLRMRYLRYAVGRHFDRTGAGPVGVEMRGRGGCEKMLDLIEVWYVTGQLDGLAELPEDFREHVQACEVALRRGEAPPGEPEGMIGGEREMRALLQSVGLCAEAWWDQIR